jgi:hypothetical protein
LHKKDELCIPIISIAFVDLRALILGSLCGTSNSLYKPGYASGVDLIIYFTGIINSIIMLCYGKKTKNKVAKNIFSS